MFTNGFFSELPQEHSAVLAAVSTFTGTSGFRRVATKGSEFTYLRHRFFPDRFQLSVEPAGDVGAPKTKVTGMFAPDPLRNWFQLHKPLQDVSAFRSALFAHVSQILPPPQV